MMDKAKTTADRTFEQVTSSFHTLIVSAYIGELEGIGWIHWDRNLSCERLICQSIILAAPMLLDLVCLLSSEDKNSRLHAQYIIKNIFLIMEIL